MRSYPLLLNGRDDDGTGWTYVPRASEMLADPEGVFASKRRLELGKSVLSDEPDVMVGRCALGGARENLVALESAAAAAPEFACTSLDWRLGIVKEIALRLSAMSRDFLDVLIAEGHPRRLAEWEIDGCLRGLDPKTLEWLAEQMHQEFETSSHRLILQRKPDGVVCVNPPQNAAARTQPWPSWLCSRAMRLWSRLRGAPH
jgi:acyl-CoA reductase-like NAD-dependent aldehyde dehydrogenase